MLQGLFTSKLQSVHSASMARGALCVCNIAKVINHSVLFKAVLDGFCNLLIADSPLTLHFLQFFLVGTWLKAHGLDSLHGKVAGLFRQHLTQGLAGQ